MTVNAETPVSRPLDGRVAIVTGASSGLGARFATVLAAAGAQVRRLRAPARADRGARRLGSLDPPDPLRRHRRGATAASSSVPRSTASAGSTCCVNNAGTSSGGPERQAELQSFRDVLRVNLESVFALSQLVSEPMRGQGSGSVINISSMFGQVASTPVPDAGYVASKAAVNGLTRELANQWGGDGVRVNAIAPGLVPDRDERRARPRTSARGDGSSASARWGAWAGRTSSTACSCSSRRTRRRTAPAR